MYKLLEEVSNKIEDIKLDQIIADKQIEEDRNTSAELMSEMQKLVGVIDKKGDVQ